jgi:hypothetical protein
MFSSSLDLSPDTDNNLHIYFFFRIQSKKSTANTRDRIAVTFAIPTDTKQMTSANKVHVCYLLFNVNRQTNKLVENKALN